MTLCHNDCPIGNLLRDEGRLVWADWQEAGIGQGANDLYQRADMPVDRVVVRAYQERLEEETGVPVPFELDLMTHFHLDQVTIDHVYPQNPNPTDIDPSLEPLKHTIGDLTILASTENSSCSNKLFLIKKPNYLASQVAITRNIAVNSSWTSAEIGAHRDQLLDMALHVLKFSRE